MKRSDLVFLLVPALCIGAAASPSAAEQAPDPERYLVKFVGPDRGRAALAASGATVLLELPAVGAAAARITGTAIDALRQNPNIEYIEPDPPRYPMAQATPYGIALVQADQVSDANAGNRKVCIIDSGYSLGHADLPSGDAVAGTNDPGTGDWFVDNCGHGTHVAGTIAALTNNVGVLGVLPGGQINLHIIKVFEEQGINCQFLYSSTLIDAAFKCRDAGANVINMSLGCTGPGCNSETEENAFNTLFDDHNMLSIAAAGNNGSGQKSYPASYDSVISVAAIDSAKVIAGFSQRNNQVELSAPGVAVRSTVPMGTGTEESLVVGDVAYEVVQMKGSPETSGTGPLVDCGLGTSACPGGGGQICLIERGGNTSFADKVLNCWAGDGVGAVIYNNNDPLLFGTLGETVTYIPSVGTYGATGQILLGLEGQSATVTTGPGGYDFFNGTSMATPHVAGVAALVWSHDPTWTNQQIRAALAATAEDLGSAGRDNTYGWGLVRAKAALDFLQNGDGCPFEDHLVLSGQMVTGNETFEACITITVGPDFNVGASGEVTFRAGERVILGEGFTVEPGGKVNTEIVPM